MNRDWIQGTVKNWNSSKHFGFITQANGTDVFVHQSGLIVEEDLRQGAQVLFLVQYDEQKGKYSAFNVVEDTGDLEFCKPEDTGPKEAGKWAEEPSAWKQERKSWEGEQQLWKEEEKPVWKAYASDWKEGTGAWEEERDGGRSSWKDVQQGAWKGDEVSGWKVDRQSGGSGGQRAGSTGQDESGWLGGQRGDQSTWREVLQMRAALEESKEGLSRETIGAFGYGQLPPQSGGLGERAVPY
eukprot:CAMPEP_0171094946 /NCGR_PEP_ID=MMETSP0766_2-20121228/42894_1 /TAXON_ID=439317 /ORGANISM="Gambierdiscus australes, Strain CAWD 149" /LENGTH=239 /DNA_ID=CAMNT_0011553697 /DNA_START=53 /DNA_END=772 /DNA_ORIENTATION=+